MVLPCLVVVVVVVYVVVVRYVLPAHAVGCGCYQDRIGLLDTGALEVIASATVAKIEEWAFVQANADDLPPPPPFLL